MRRRLPSSRGAVRLDQWVLHPFWGLVIFFALFWVTFAISQSVGSWVTPRFEAGLDGLRLSLGFQPHVGYAFLQGAFQGLKITLGFVPALLGLFMALGFLERVGYLSRAGRLWEGLMQKIGLGGHSLVPLLIGFGCNVPAMLSVQSIQDPVRRRLTLMMLPFMSCSARLAVYTVFVSVFFERWATEICWGLYVLGILMGLLTVWCLKEPASKKRRALDSAEVRELSAVPAWHWPTVSMLYQVLKDSLVKMGHFVFKVSGLVMPIAGLLAALTEWPDAAHPFIKRGVLALSPIFQWMGLTEENWPALLALLSGILAKEIVLGVLAGLYGAGDVASALGTSLSHYFTPASAAAYLVFILLYFPCASVLAGLVRLLGWRWALFSMVWSTGWAYGVSVLVYQILSGRLDRNAWPTVLAAMGLAASVIALKTYFFFGGGGDATRRSVGPRALPTPISLKVQP